MPIAPRRRVDPTSTSAVANLPGRVGRQNNVDIAACNQVKKRDTRPRRGAADAWVRDNGGRRQGPSKSTRALVQIAAKPWSCWSTWIGYRRYAGASCPHGSGLLPGRGV